MSILDFSDYLVGLPLTSSPSDKDLGSFDNGADARQIKHIRALMYFEGQYNTEKLSLSITDSLTSPTVTYTSDVINVVDLDPSLRTDTNYLTWVRFDFNKEWLDASGVYYVQIASTNYTEATGKSMNLIFDYPVPIYGARLGNASDHPIAMQIYCLEEYE